MTDIREMTFKQTLCDLPNRFVTLIWKMLSVKGEALIMAFYLVVSGHVTEWHAVVLFLVTAFLVIFGRDGLKYLEVLKDLK